MLCEIQTPTGRSSVVRRTSHRLTPSIPRCKRIWRFGLSTHARLISDVKRAGLLSTGPISPRDVRKVISVVPNAIVNGSFEFLGAQRTTKKPIRGRSRTMASKLIDYLQPSQVQKLPRENRPGSRWRSFEYFRIVIA